MKTLYISEKEAPENVSMWKLTRQHVPELPYQFGMLNWGQNESETITRVTAVFYFLDVLSQFCVKWSTCGTHHWSFGQPNRQLISWAWTLFFCNYRVTQWHINATAQTVWLLVALDFLVELVGKCKHFCIHDIRSKTAAILGSMACLCEGKTAWQEDRDKSTEPTTERNAEAHKLVFFTCKYQVSGGNLTSFSQLTDQQGHCVCVFALGVWLIQLWCVTHLSVCSIKLDDCPILRICSYL